MSRKGSIREWIGAALVAVAAITVAASTFYGRDSGSERPAARLGKRLGERLAVLDSYIGKALESENGTWMELRGIPEDMVVYRYAEDTLQSWANQFPVRSDDIRSRTVVQRLGASRSDAESPLADIGPEWTYANHGPKWYVEKSVIQADVRIIAGLELVDELQTGSLNGINPNLKLSDRYSLRPLSTSSGTAVSVDGVPLLKLVPESVSAPEEGGNVVLQVIVLLLLLAGMMFWLAARPTGLWLAAVAGAQTLLLGWMYFHGRSLGQSSQLFSPLLYADGPVLYSLGAVVLVNALIVLLVWDLYIVRLAFLKGVREKASGAIQAVIAVTGFLAVAGIAVYLHFAFVSVNANSDICLELYKIPRLTGFTAVVYASFLSLALSLPPLIQILSPFFRSLFGLRYNMFSVPSRAGWAVVIGTYFVATAAILGFRNEENRVNVWANRLAMDRDIGLEMQLRTVEGAIAQDQMFGALGILDGGSELIRERLVTSYMGRISQDYDITVLQAGGNLGAHPLFQDRVRGGVRLSDASHFFYSTIGSGRVAYTGVFTWYVQNYGPSSMMVSVESKHNREDRGYLSLLGVSEPGRVSLPRVYAWAKYSSGQLTQYKGSFGYPTVYSGRIASVTRGHTHSEGWCHFVHRMSEEEVIVISRERTSVLDYAVSGVLFALLAYFLLALMSWRTGRGTSPHYYQNRISIVLYTSLFLTLVAMAGFSVWFVYKRNTADIESVMVSRVTSIQAMLQENLRQLESPDGLRTVQVREKMEDVGNNLRCDITLFDVSGRMAFSTTPEVYDRMILGRRLEDNAYYNIVYGHKRYFIQREKAGRRSYFALYAPVFNSGSQMIGIMSSPFTGLTYDFESDAVRHIATVITIFLLLLLLARIFTYEVVSRMFRPISQLSRRMKVTDVDHLEHLSYSGDDEITPLVDAYNRMVDDLGESSRRLAQVERDKAWTDMARRVAHDLKNPLTPIKLQLQMLIRMKGSGNPAWQERFDDVASTVLYHVDLLADSADQFSTFAKMYDQKAERLDLDALVKQEVDLFASREDVTLEYFGLPETFVNAPRPQLTRVVVNLLTNAMQAVSEGGRILVSVRNASEDGFYEVVVEDNGPGVSEELQEKIFTPDFTTKTSGSGLGLAICRRIVDHCGGSISYSRSFVLGGACFTVKYPKARN